MVRIISLSEVQEHGPSHAEPWIILYGKVLSVGSYKDEHPGGDEVFIDYAGKDATKQFEGADHGSSAKRDMLQYVIGEVEGASSSSEQTTATTNTNTTTTTEEKKDCSIQ